MRRHEQLTTLKESMYIRYIPILDDYSLAHVHHTLAVLHNITRPKSRFQKSADQWLREDT